MKIDHRIKYHIVIDTETCPLDKDEKSVSPSNMFVYDIGWAIVDKRGKVYETKSFVNADIFLNEKELMKSAYYAEKVPKYWEDIHNGKRVLKSLYNIRKEFIADYEKYNVKEIYAHNMRFDIGSLNNTERWLTKSKFRSFFPHNAIICDTMKMARDVILPMPSYRKFCEDNGYMTKHKTPRPQLKAEVIYKFITQDTEFVESHTGLEDVLIEKDIMAYCYGKHKKMRKELYHNKGGAKASLSA